MGRTAAKNYYVIMKLKEEFVQNKIGEKMEEAMREDGFWLNAETYKPSCINNYLGFHFLNCPQYTLLKEEDYIERLNQKCTSFIGDYFGDPQKNKPLLYFNNYRDGSTHGLINKIHMYLVGEKQEDAKEIIKTSMFLINPEVKKKESLALVFQATTSYDKGIVPEEIQVNKETYEKMGIIGNVEKRVEYFDMGNSFILLFGKIKRELNNNLDGIETSDAKDNKFSDEKKINKFELNSAINISKKLRSMISDKNTDNSVIGRILFSSELQEAATLYYSIGNYIPVIDEKANREKANACYDIFDVYYMENTESLKGFYSEDNENEYCMHMDYYKVIENEKYLDDIINYSKVRIESSDINCGDGTYNIASILELYNFFNLRIKLRSAWICAVVAKNSEESHDDDESRKAVVQEFVNIAKQYEEELHRSIAILDCFAGVSERTLTKIDFGYLTNEKENEEELG